MDGYTLMERKECPLCNCTERSVYIPFLEIPVVQCADCSFIYSSQVLSDEDLATYYETGFGSHRHMQGQIINARVNAWMLGRLMDIRSVSSILDVGTGYGLLLDELRKRHGLEGDGVELSRQEAEYARDTLGLNVINTMLNQSGLEKESYGLLASFEVLEHTLHPIDFIRETAEYVKPGGYLLIVTDNFRNKTVQSLGAAFPKWIPHSHVSHFSDETLIQAVERAGGLSVVKAASFTPWELMARNAQRKLLRRSTTPEEAFDLEATLKSEMGGTYKLFNLRKRVNEQWIRWKHRMDLSGEMMYLLLEKRMDH